MQTREYLGVMDYPSTEDLTPAMKEYLPSYLHTTDDVFFGTSYTDPLNGYHAYIDAASFIGKLFLYI